MIMNPEDVADWAWSMGEDAAQLLRWWRNNTGPDELPTLTRQWLAEWNQPPWRHKADEA